MKTECKRKAVLFACGNRLVHCSMSDEALLSRGAMLTIDEHAAGETIQCPLCKHCAPAVQKNSYTVLNALVIGKGWDGLDLALKDRSWNVLEDEQYDLYSLASDLNLYDETRESQDNCEIIIVELQRN